MTSRLPTTPSLTTSESLLLDVVRVGASMLVVIGHLTQPFFSTGWPDLVPIARASVAVFFVLSGFVIRYVTCHRHSTFGNYLQDRATRIYSVALPALIVTFILDAISRHRNLLFYSNWIAETNHLTLRFLANAVFCAQIWTWEISPLSNSPFWSLNYEVPYYLLYGCAFYLTGTRRILWMALIALIVGPKVLLLFPVWLIGCIAHDLYQRWTVAGTARTVLNRATLGLLAGSIALIAFLRFDTAAATIFFHARIWLYLESERLHLGQTGGVFPFFIIGLAGTVVLLRGLQLVQKIQLSNETWWVRVIRFIAEGTFPMYVLHFPLLVFLAACIPYDHARAPQKIAIFLLICGISVLAGPPCNRLRDRMRLLSGTFALGRKPEPGT